MGLFDIVQLGLKKKMRSTVKILAIIGAILSLPLIIFGWGLLITIPLVILAIALDKKPSPTGTSNSSKKWALIATAVGLAVFFGIFVLGSFGNLDTTGKPSGAIIIIGLIIGVLVAVGVYALGKRDRNTLPPA
jgi:glycerol uptake facilitator-like aquaporin